MPIDSLKWIDRPVLPGGRMILAFSGWMDGGDVSTGTVERLIDEHDANRFAEIDPEGFFIYNFPGSMELSALFRPHVEIRDGLIEGYEPPDNAFFAAPARNLLFFVGREPNLNWRQFGDCIFEVAAQTGVKTILFVGSFGGTVPHTREPRMFVSVSDEKLRATYQRYGMRPSNYEGPGSFSSYLMTQAGRRGLDMASFVAEIPGYLQGSNPRCIEAVTRRLAAVLGLQIDLARLRGDSDEWEAQVSAAVAKDEELAQQIQKLEEQYDEDLIDKGTAE